MRSKNNQLKISFKYIRFLITEVALIGTLRGNSAFSDERRLSSGGQKGKEGSLGDVIHVAAAQDHLCPSRPEQRTRDKNLEIK